MNKAVNEEMDVILHKFNNRLIGNQKIEKDSTDGLSQKIKIYSAIDDVKYYINHKKEISKKVEQFDSVLKMYEEYKKITKSPWKSLPKYEPAYEEVDRVLKMLHNLAKGSESNVLEGNDSLSKAVNVHDAVNEWEEYLRLFYINMNKVKQYDLMKKRISLKRMKDKKKNIYEERV